jgi:hypothetical protein
MASNTVVGHQEGDAFAPKPSTAQEEYYQFMLYKEKLIASGTDKDEVAQILGATSELERLEKKIIRKLSTDEKYTQSGANYQVLSQLTGETSYIGIGKWLALKIYEKRRAEYLIDTFAGEGTKIKDLQVKNSTFFGFPLPAVLGGGAAP